MEQLNLDIAPCPVFRVGVRIGNENQVYDIEAVTYQDAMQYAKEGVEGAKVVLALVNQNQGENQ